jgi:hypothetical protein
VLAEYIEYLESPREILEKHVCLCRLGLHCSTVPYTVNRRNVPAVSCDECDSTIIDYSIDTLSYRIVS